MISDNKVAKAVNRYNRVKSHIKSQMDSDLSNYVQRLIQANRLNNQLILEVIEK